MTSSTPRLDAHDHQLTQAFTDFVVHLGPQELLEIGCEDSAAAKGLRAAGRLIRCVALDDLPLEDADGSVDVVLLRDVLSTAANPLAAAVEAWRVARRCVIVAETEYLVGVRSQARMRTLDALINDVRIARGFPPVHPLGVGDVLSILREEPAAVTPHAWHTAIVVGETTVGFVMVSTDPDDDESPYLSRFMIDARHQGRGAGRRALELVCEHFAAVGATAFHCAIVEGPGSPRAFYEAQGFVATGKVDHGEVVLRRPLG